MRTYKEIVKNYILISTKLAHEKAYETLTKLRLNIINHLKKLNLGFFKEHNTGELTNIMQHDVEQVEIYLAHGLPEIMSVTLLPSIILIAMIFVDFRLALGMIVGVPLMFLVKVLSQNTMNKNFGIYFNHENRMREELMKRCDFYREMVEAQNKVDRWNLKEVITENV